MKRIMVIGVCGAGKSTFARRLNNISQIELIHLDQYYWKPGWKETDSLTWETIVKNLADNDSWIIDGNYGGTIDIRMKRADTIIYLDYPILKSLWRVTKRIIRHYGKTRPDMAEGCNERFDLQFFHYVATFNIRKRSALLKKLTMLKESKKIMIFRKDKEANQFLTNLKRSIHQN